MPSKAIKTVFIALLAFGFLASNGLAQYGYDSSSGSDPNSGPSNGDYGSQGDNSPQEKDPFGFGGNNGGFDFSMGGAGDPSQRGFLGAGSMIETLVGAQLMRATIANRTEMKENCLLETDASKAANVQLLLNAYDPSRITSICERQSDMANSSCGVSAEEYCTFNNFARMAPPDVKKTVEEMGLNVEEFLNFSSLSQGDIEGRIERICRFMFEKETVKHDEQMQVEFKRELARFRGECQRYKDREVIEGQRIEQDNQWQQGGSGPYGPSSNVVIDCPQNQYWNGQQCITKQGAPYCGDNRCDNGENDNTCPNDCGPQPVCGNAVCEWGEYPNCTQDCEQQQSSECGNSKCEEGENSDNCSNDCGHPAPVCGNGNCESGEDSYNCSNDCGSPPPEPFCGDGICEGAENSENCSSDCGEGELAGSVLDQIFGQSLFPLLGFIPMAQLQNYDPYGSGTGQCPPGEYRGVNDYGQESCIRSDSGFGGPSGNYGPGPGGPYNLGPGVTTEDCDLGDDAVIEKMKAEMGGGSDMSEEADRMCTEEAKRRGAEIANEMFRGEIEAEFCMARHEIQCAFMEEMAAECQDVINDVPGLIANFVDLKCEMIVFKEGQRQTNFLTSVGLDFYESSALDETAGQAAAGDILKKHKVIEEKKQDVGILNIFTGNEELGNAYGEVVTELDKKEEYIEEVLDTQELTSSERDKLEEMKEKIEETRKNYKSREDAEKGGFFGIFGRMFAPPE
ncbi:hypothetical protein KKE06_01270 [Candidatus Micrarchaeota archaeon]|nr:hypothetical protein [Candidatus Micrarchaeota archaeon]MBU1930036.1 hypothetical protein [Candidatus Micrarchaeota archaeon]